jgi:hypothetical protein
MPRDPGYTCGFSKPCNIRDGTLRLTVSARPGPGGRFSTVPAGARKPHSAFVGGSPADEAKSLLRPCLPHGQYGALLKSLPPFIAQNIGTAVKITQPQITKFLRDSGVLQADLGGPLASALPGARYFAIHDTSTKPDNWINRRSFPDDINSSGWTHNQRSNLNQKSDAHVFISRLGESNTAHDFSVPWSATKYTGGDHTRQPPQLKRKFCHVEMIQPRLGIPGNLKSDWIAPTPGFPTVQLARLALVYIAASIRHGEWLIPAYHHNIDMGFDAHDDPQNFDLLLWDSLIAETVKDIVPVRRPGDFPTEPTDRQSG